MTLTLTGPTHRANGRGTDRVAALTHQYEAPIRQALERNDVQTAERLGRAYDRHVARLHHRETGLIARLFRRA